MRVYIGADHAGYTLKEAVKPYLESKGFEVVDVGTDSADESVDYPDFAERVARAVASGEAERGVLVCGTGMGMEIAANKVPGVRAAMVNDTELARLAREHNDANVLTMGGRTTDPQVAKDIIDVFFGTEFEGGRHQRRIDKISGLEKNGR